MSTIAARNRIARRTPFTPEQEDRVRYLLAYGPASKQPGDDALIADGIVEHYDGMDDVVDLSAAATHYADDGSTALFHRNGTMHPWLVARR